MDSKQSAASIGRRITTDQYQPADANHVEPADNEKDVVIHVTFLTLLRLDGSREYTSVSEMTSCYRRISRSIVTANCTTANAMNTGPNRMLNGMPMISSMMEAMTIAIHDRRHVAHAVNQTQPSSRLTRMTAGITSFNLALPYSSLVAVYVPCPPIPLNMRLEKMPVIRVPY